LNFIEMSEMKGVWDVVKVHPALLVLVLASKRPSLLLDAKSLHQELLRAGFIVSRRMCYNYTRWLVQNGYVIIIEDSKGKRVELTDKARRFVESVFKGDR